MNFRSPLLSFLTGMAALALTTATVVPSATADQGPLDLEGLSPEEAGYAVAQRNDLSDRGFSSQTATLTMTLRDARGQTTVRDMQIDTFEKEGEGNGDRSLTRFFSPPDVEGTALLSHARVLDPDNQWLYLPALRRVKRISSSNKSGPFVGSEFAFEDLTGNELRKYSYNHLGTVEFEGMTLHQVECVPLYERSGYTKLFIYYDDEHFQTRGIEFFDRGGNLFKTLRLTDYRQYEGQYWRPHRQEMTNHLTGKSTVLEYESYEFGVDLNQRDFEPSALDRL